MNDTGRRCHTCLGSLTSTLFALDEIGVGADTRTNVSFFSGGSRRIKKHPLMVKEIFA